MKRQWNLKSSHKLETLLATINSRPDICSDINMFSYLV